MRYTGFDIGGTKCAVCLGEEIGGKINIIEKKKILTDHSKSPYEIIDSMCDMAKAMGLGERIGISCGGPLDSKNGIIQSPPNLPKWDNIEIVRYVEERLGVKAILQNDANACAVAEWKYGAGVGSRNMIFLTFGTGFGAGLILDGKLYVGANDNAGEVGHIRLSENGPVGYGKEGSVEGFCSGGGIAQLGRIKATERLQMGKSVSYCKSYEELPQINAKKIADFADAGFEDAKEVYKLCGEKLGNVLSVLIDILNPDTIVIGSIFQRSENLLREAMEEKIKKECLSAAREICKIVPAKLEENLGDYAAIAIAAMCP